MNYFFPKIFNDEHKYYSILLTSVILWIYFILYYNGLYKILILNSIATFCKIFVIVFYIFALLIFININKIKTNFWGKNEKAIDIIKHLKNAYIICIFCYLGIETSTTLSNKSKSEKLISNAINLSYIIVSIFIYYHHFYLMEY